MYNINEDIAHIFQKELHLLILDDKVALNLAQRNALMQSYITSGDESLRKRYNEMREESWIAEEKALALSDSEELRQLVTKKKEWGKLGERILSIVDEGDRSKAASVLYFDGQQLNTDLTNGFDRLSAGQENRMITFAEELSNNTQNILSLVTTLSFIVIALGIVLALVLSNSISKPLIAVTNRMKDIADGNLQGKAFESTLIDENGQLMAATNDMSQNLLKMIQNIQSITNGTAENSKSLAHFSDVAQSDTEQIAATMEELASGTETQAKTASDLAGSMDHFSRAIQTAYDNGEDTLHSSKSVLSLADEGKQKLSGSAAQMQQIQEIIKESVNRMSHLEAQTSKITELVGVVQGIASQTNLLALNASIEAARAGEQGRGFAVVADEVRKLAEQVSDSVENITGIVKTIQDETLLTADTLTTGYKEVEKGAELLHGTGDSFFEINTSIHGVAQRIQTITSNLESILKTSEDMSSSIDDIAAVSQESAAGVEETAASAQQISNTTEEVAKSSRRLAHLSEELNDVVSLFQI